MLLITVDASEYKKMSRSSCDIEVEGFDPCLAIQKIGTFPLTAQVTSIPNPVAGRLYSQGPKDDVMQAQSAYLEIQPSIV
jgi:hypothetical protein